MADLPFNQEIIKTVVGGVVGGAVPTAVLVFGGRLLLDRYDIRKKRREQELEESAKKRSQELEEAANNRARELDLVGFVRQRQYEALQELYLLFAQFMSLYRLINSGHIDLKDQASRLKLLEQISVAEGRVDAAILRIASEFTHKNSDRLKEYLPELRQSVQIWRERIRVEEDLPFHSSNQPDYVRFKVAFTRTCTYLASLIYKRIEQPDIIVDEAVDLLNDTFDNKHERHGHGRKIH